MGVESVEITVVGGSSSTVSPGIQQVAKDAGVTEEYKRSFANVKMDEAFKQFAKFLESEENAANVTSLGIELKAKKGKAVVTGINIPVTPLGDFKALQKEREANAKDVLKQQAEQIKEAEKAQVVAKKNE